MGNGRFALSAKDLNMEMCQATCYGECHAEAAGCIKGAQLKVVIQGAHLMEVSDQPQLSTGVPRGHV